MAGSCCRDRPKINGLAEEISQATLNNNKAVQKMARRSCRRTGRGVGGVSGSTGGKEFTGINGAQRATGDRQRANCANTSSRRRLANHQLDRKRPVANR